MASNGRVNLAVLATKVDLQTEAINRLIVKFDKHIEDNNEVAKTVDRLDQKDKSRTRQFQVMWTAIAGGAVAFVVNLFRTQ